MLCFGNESSCLFLSVEKLTNFCNSRGKSLFYYLVEGVGFWCGNLCLVFSRGSRPFITRYPFTKTADYRTIKKLCAKRTEKVAFELSVEKWPRKRLSEPSCLLARLFPAAEASLLRNQVTKTVKLLKILISQRPQLS